MVRTFLLSRVCVALVAALVVTTPSLPTASAPARTASYRAGSSYIDVYRNASGARAYKVFVPSSYRPGRAMPLLVALHGCYMTGFGLNSMEEMSGLSRLAAERGFVVVYPSQSLVAHLQLCWNFDKPEHWQRGSGEPSLIAGITQQVSGRWHLDPRRTYIVGASSGAAMAAIMGVTYPDRYTAIGIGAGCEYGCSEAVQEHPDAISPQWTARLAYRAMGSHARAVPTFIMQGTADPVVPVFAARRLVTHWATIDDLAPDGAVDGDVDDVPERIERIDNPGDHAYTRYLYTARQSHDVLIQLCLVDGLGHAWPGARGGLFGDPAGPDASALLWEFLSAHAMP